MPPFHGIDLTQIFSNSQLSICVVEVLNKQCIFPGQIKILLPLMKPVLLRALLHAFQRKVKRGGCVEYGDDCIMGMPSPSLSATLPAHTLHISWVLSSSVQSYMCSFILSAMGNHNFFVFHFIFYSSSFVKIRSCHSLQSASHSFPASVCEHISHIL